MSTNTLPQTEIEDVQAVLDTLTGWRCTTCRETLLTRNQHICCGKIYCPFCGKAHCEHLLAMVKRGKVSYWPRYFPDVPQKAKKIRNGTARFVAWIDWSEAQKQEVFGDDYALVQTLFGPRFTGKDLPRRGGCHRYTEQLLQTEHRTVQRLPHRHVNRAYFSEMPGEPRARLTGTQERLNHASRKLCAMRPESHRFYLGFLKPTTGDDVGSAPLSNKSAVMPINKEIKALAFSEKGNYLTTYHETAAYRMEVGIKDAPREEVPLPATLPLPQPPLFLHDGRTQLVWEGAYRLRLQNRETGEFLNPDIPFRHEPRGIALSPDGETVAIAYPGTPYTSRDIALLWRFPKACFYAV